MKEFKPTAGQRNAQSIRPLWGVAQIKHLIDSLAMLADELYHGTARVELGKRLW